MFGNLTLFASDADNTKQVEAKMWKKQGGEYRLLPFKLPAKNLCDFLNQDTIVIPDMVKVSNIPSPMPCPVPQVKSLINNLTSF
jgi:Protein of unknown function (DUF1091)